MIPVKESLKKYKKERGEVGGESRGMSSDKISFGF